MKGENEEIKGIGKKRRSMKDAITDLSHSI
jgi:hypothetical protein